MIVGVLDAVLQSNANGFRLVDLVISGRIRKFENRSGDVRAWDCVYVIFVYLGNMHWAACCL